MKKGFTLVEVLAVIVILTVISLITIPRFSKMINAYKINAAKTSVLGYIDAVDKQQAFNFNDDKSDNNILAGFYQVPFDDVYEISFDGKKPTDGWVEMTANGASRYSVVIDGYVITNDGNKIKIRKGTKPVKQAYPKYAYSNSFGTTRVGYPIDGGYDMGKTWVIKFGDYAGAFGDEETCKTTAQMIGTNCVYENFITYEIDYKSIPDNSWKNYLRFKLATDGTIEEIDTCIKYKGDEHCVAPNVDSAGYLNSKKRLSSIFDNNCYEEDGMYKCANDGMYFEVCPKGCVGAIYGTNFCDILATGIAYCVDSSMFPTP